MGLLGDMFEDAGEFAGNILGGITGATVGTIAAALSLPVKGVKAAMEAGCETHEEIRDWCRENFDPDW